MLRTRTLLALYCGAILACKGDDAPGKNESPAKEAPLASHSRTPEVAEPSEPRLPVVEDFAIGEREADALDAIHSLPAWGAAIERYRFLERRGQSGLVHGTLAEADGDLWLVDETVGDGALSIPIAVPDGMELSLPMRAVVWGAWKPEESPSWRWHATRVARLPGDAVSHRPRLEPMEEAFPEDAVPASEANRRGGAISFVVVQDSLRVGDGWLIADDTASPAAARLLLPGELETYGDQSELGGDERWKLKKNTRYWLTIRSVRGTRPDELPVYRASCAPRFDPRGPSAAPAEVSKPASASTPGAAP